MQEDPKRRVVLGGKGGYWGETKERNDGSSTSTTCTYTNIFNEHIYIYLIFSLTARRIFIAYSKKYIYTKVAPTQAKK